MQQRIQHAFQLLQQGHRQQAEQICRSVLAHYPHQPDALNLIGLLERERGSLEQARQLFLKGLKKAPRHLHLMNSVGLVEQDLGEFAKSEAHFHRVLKIDPAHFQARYNLANLYQTQGKFETAKRLYQQVIRQQPKFVDALANLSTILEQQHQLDEAKSLANQALEIDPDHLIARLTLANIAAREKSFDEVTAHLLPLIQTGELSPVNYAMACGKCAYAYEKKGEYQKAFSFYQDANQALYRFFKPQYQDLESFHGPAAIRRIENVIPDFDFSTGSSEATSPVFLIGFPRSGTTLLDQILSSHSRITVMEEKQNLEEICIRFPATEKGLKELKNASDSELKKLRQKYWHRVKREIDTKKSTPIIIDKYPLNAIALLHISKLFPGAKIIAAIRDPRDCVFSCYQQRFGMNHAMFQLLNLDTAVSYYDQVMNVIVGIRDANALPIHFIRYEKVVGDFENEVSSLTGFLGLEWEDSLHDYQATAKSRYISTPSAAQVIQPLYTSSIGKWRHYQEWIGTNFEPLDKWEEEWGYQ